MSKTRYERKRDQLRNRLVAVIVVAFWLTYCIVFLSSLEVRSTPQEVDNTPLVEPTQQVQIITSLPDIPEEVANKEAQMPEFGYNYGYVCAVVASECRGEPYEGQLAVAQCIRTSAERKLLTPEEVVKLPNRYADPCTYASDIELVRDACCDVFVHGISATDEPIEYFYSTVGGFVSEWHENNLEFVMEIGNHRFFKEVDA